MASKFSLARSKEQQDLLKELISNELPDSDTGSIFKAISHKISNKKFMSVNSNEVRRRFDRLIRKFRVARQSDLANDLERFTAEYLEQGEEEDAGGREDVEIECSVMQFLMAVSRNPVNILYTSEKEPGKEEEEEEWVDWHKILVADFIDSGPSEEEWSSSGEEEEDLFTDEEPAGPQLGLVVREKPAELEIATVPHYSDICQTVVHQYWKTQVKPLTELQIIREVLTMLQGAPTSFVFPTIEDEVHLAEGLIVAHYSPAALTQILLFFREKIKMVQKLHWLCDEVMNCVAQPSHPYGSRTFQAFICSLIMYLQQLSRSIHEIELKVQKQREVVSLIVLKDAVRDHFDIVTALYDMVEAILESVEVDCPSLCVTRLVNILFESVQLYESMGVLTEHITRVILTVLLCTLHPLLATIEQWLSEGELNNTTGELFFVRDPDVSYKSPLFWSQGLVLKHPGRRSEDQIPGVFLALADKMLKAGKAIELLKNLGKLGVGGRELFGQLLEQYFESGAETTTAVVERGGDLVKTSEVVLHADPLILSLFSDSTTSSPLPWNTSSAAPSASSTAPPASSTVPSDSLYGQIYGRISQLHILPSATITKILSPILSERCRRVSLSLLTSLRVDFSLDTHLDTLRQVLLMEAGHAMSGFSEELYKSAYAREGIRAMTPFLRECLAPYTALTAHLRMEVTRTAVPGSKTPELDPFQSVRVTYTPPFPIGLVLDSELMEVYQRVFTLLLEINYAAWCVQPLSLGSNQPGPVPTAVHVFRHQLVNFIRVIQTYTMQRVLHCTGTEMRRDLESALELDEYVAVHRRYCYLMEEYCLLTPEFRTILGAIRLTLNEGVRFRRCWERGELREGQVLAVVEQVQRCIQFVAKLVAKRNQMANVPQSHFEWLETALG